MEIKVSAKSLKDYIRSGTTVRRKDYASITDENRGIDDLLEMLKSKGVEVDIEDSERKISIGKKDKITRVPLQTHVEGENNVEAYILRVAEMPSAESLDIVIKDYHEGRSLSPGRVGGSSCGKDGVVADIHYKSEGDYSKAELQEIARTIGDIKEVLEKFYSPYRLFSKEQVKVSKKISKKMTSKKR